MCLILSYQNIAKMTPVYIHANPSARILPINEPGSERKRLKEAILLEYKDIIVL